MLSQLLHKMLKVGLPLTVLLATIGCSVEHAGDIGKQGVGVADGMVAPKIVESNYSTNITSLGSISGGYGPNCKSSSGGTQTAISSIATQVNFNSLAIVPNDTDCSLILYTINATTVAGGGPTGNYVAASPGMLAPSSSTGTFGSLTTFTNGTSKIYAKSKLVWTSPTALTMTIAYANDPSLLPAVVASGTYATITPIQGSTSLVPNPTYSAVYNASATALTRDINGYIQPTPTGTFTIAYDTSGASGSPAQTAQYYTVFPKPSNPGTTFTLSGAYNALSTTNFSDLSGAYNASATNSFLTFLCPTSCSAINPVFTGSSLAPLTLAPTTLASPLTLKLFTSSPSTEWSLVSHVTSGTTPCGSNPTNCNTSHTGSTISNTVNGTSFPLPTFIPAGGLVYYVVLAHLDIVSLVPSFELITLNINPI